MSKIKNMFKKNKYKTKVEPRSMPEIRGEYQALSSQAGELQYQIHVHTKTLANLNVKLESLNYEASARQKLDKDAAASAAPEAAKTAEA